VHPDPSYPPAREENARGSLLNGRQKARRRGPFPDDGACRDRTGDLRLAKPALSQLS
jgi:hypothetical protein